MIEAPRRQTRSRLQPEARKAQIVDAAAALIVRQGLLPVALDALSRDLGISKGLIYSYFPTQYDLVNAVLRHHLTELFGAPLAQALRADDDSMARACSGAYFDHVAAYGPLLHILFTDLYMAHRIEPDLVIAATRIIRRLARWLRQNIGLSANESIAALEMLSALPEEAGALVYRERLELEVGRELCLELTAGGLEYLQAAQNDRRA